MQTKSQRKCEYVKTSTITLVLLQIISDDIDEEEDNKNQVYTLGSITKSLLCHLSRDKSLFREQTASLLDKAIRVVNSSHMLVVFYGVNGDIFVRISIEHIIISVCRFLLF